MKKLWILVVSLFPLLSFSQRLHVTLFAGFSNYQGDLQDKPFTLDQSNGAFGAGLKYNVNGHLSIRTGVVYGKVEASDKSNKASLQLRNLSFESKLVEGNLLLEYNLFDLEERRFTPYLFAGGAVFHFNPYAFDSLGNKIELKPLSTEGQGLAQYPARKPYKLTQFAVPFGGGIKMRVSDNVILGYEIGLRKLFTDYLDDVSSTYVNPLNLGAARGFRAVEMAYRGDEIKNGDPLYPADGSLRGSVKQKDWYYFHGITLSIGLNKGEGNGWRGKRNQMGCPVRVM
ncbi:MAG: DUF6089 family protein [Chitinophagaceae bacterium]